MNHTLYIQSDSEILSDIIDIEKLVYPRKIILVSHYNAKKSNGEYLHSRNELILLLEKIAKDRNIPFVNPTLVLSSYPQEDILENDLCHYTELGLSLMADYLTTYSPSIL